MLAPIFLNMLLLYGVAASDIGEVSDVGEGVGVFDVRTGGDDAATGTGAGSLGAEDAGESSGEARERGKEETEVWVKQGRS